MDTPLCFNPYLVSNRCDARNARGGSRGEFLRVLPRGVIKDGAMGLIKVMSTGEPRMFFNNTEYILSKNMCWPLAGRTPVPKTARFPRDGRAFKFHTYDQVETMLYAESKEAVFSAYRRHVVPCGNVIRMFGVTARGESVCVNVFGQKTYFYCKHVDYESLRQLLLTMIRVMYGEAYECAVEIRTACRMSIYGYRHDCVTDLWVVRCCSWIITKQMSEYLMSLNVPVYEAAVDPVTRFLVDRKVDSFGWCRLRSYHIRANKGISTANIEIDCEVGDVESITDDVTWPVYRCVSFDIECMSGEDRFPSPENVEDIVIQISCICFEVGGGTPQDKEGRGDEGDEALPAPRSPKAMLFTLGPCEPIPEVDVYEFPSEYEMMLGFFTFLGWYGPEFLTGYNINGFDLKYLITRMENIYRTPVSRFTKLTSGGRFFTYVPPEKQKMTFSASSHVKVVMTGTVIIDMYGVCMSKASAQNYKLNTMAHMYLGQQKEDLSYKEIPVTFRMGDAGRAQVGKYCVKDALIVMDLFNKIAYHYEVAAIARLARIPVRRAVFDGQQVRIYTCILEEAQARHMVLPSLPRSRPFNANNDPAASNSSSSSGSDDETGKVGYQGATVFEPDVGYYDSPVAVFDFASLYPSIIMANNLCYSTLLLEDSPEVDEKDVFSVSVDDGTTYRFVSKDVSRSILADLLERWLQKRREVRALMADCDDPTLRTILDKQQLALKVTCNAFYGFTGVSSGMMPCLPIAASITSVGRAMLSKTSEYIRDNLSDRVAVERFFGQEDFIDDAEYSVKVIYGDTDSVFVLFRGVRAESVCRASPAMTAHITEALFRPPVKLEYEKVFATLMMICKKRYIGRLVGRTELVMKGVDLVRKTACEYVKSVVREIMMLLFNDSEVAAAAVTLSNMTFKDMQRLGVPRAFHKILRCLSEARDTLYLNKADVNKLCLSSVLSQDVSSYKQKNLPHLAVIRRLASRSEELPSVGDRVPYVLTAPPAGSPKNVPNYELAEDPAYVVEKGIPINAAKYFEHIVKAVANVMSPVFPKDMEKKGDFFACVLPHRVYLGREFNGVCVKAEECE
uniref:DNA polymerase n=1 Tax=Cardioderma bat herpesvirus TaxID=3141914 RepID=A0AAU7E0V4_9VIRU